MLNVNANKKVYNSFCICPVCKGERSTEKKVIDDFFDVCYISTPCEFCKGKGLMKRKVTVELLTI